MKNTIKILLFTAATYLLMFSGAYSQTVKPIKLKYDQENGILYNNEVTLKCVNYVHDYKPLKLNEAIYVNGDNSNQFEYDISLKKYIEVVNVDTDTLHAVEYWVRNDYSTFIVITNSGEISKVD